MNAWALEHKMIWDQIIDQINSDGIAEDDTHLNFVGNSKRKYYLSDNPKDYLTRREKECMDHLILGKTIKETAVIMNLSPRTVEFYLKNIRKRWGCHSKNELITRVKRYYKRQEKKRERRKTLISK